MQYVDVYEYPPGETVKQVTMLLSKGTMYSREAMKNTMVNGDELNH